MGICHQKSSNGSNEALILSNLKLLSKTKSCHNRLCTFGVQSQNSFYRSFFNFSWGKLTALIALWSKSSVFLSRSFNLSIWFCCSSRLLLRMSKVLAWAFGWSVRVALCDDWIINIRQATLIINLQDMNVHAVDITGLSNNVHAMRFWSLARWGFQLKADANDWVCLGIHLWETVLHVQLEINSIRDKQWCSEMPNNPVLVTNHINHPHSHPQFSDPPSRSRLFKHQYCEQQTVQLQHTRDYRVVLSRDPKTNRDHVTTEITHQMKPQVRSTSGCY